MLQRNKKWLVLLLSLVLVIVTACSSGGKSNNTGTPSPGTGATKGTNDGGTQKDEIVEISFWAWAPSIPIWKQIEEEFSKVHPNIKVNYTRYNAPEYHQKIRVAVQTGEAPDVMGFELATANNYLSALEPLQPYLEQYLGANWADQFIPEVVNSAQDMELKLIPTAISIIPLIAYDVDLFEKVGATPPKTMDELKEVVKKFEDAKLDGVIPRLGFPGGHANSFNDLYYNYVNQLAPGKLYEAAKGNVPFTDPDIVYATEAFKKMYNDNIVQEGNLTLQWNPELFDMFVINQQVPMIVVGSFMMKNFVEKEELQIEGRRFGIVPFPSIEGGDPVVQLNTELPLGINKDSKNKEAAWKFIEFMIAGGYQDILAETLQFLPANKDIKMDKSGIEVDTELEAANVVESLIENSVVGHRFIKDAEITNAVYLNIQKVVTNTATPLEALQEIQKAVK